MTLSCQLGFTMHWSSHPYSGTVGAPAQTLMPLAVHHSAAWQKITGIEIHSTKPTIRFRPCWVIMCSANGTTLIFHVTTGDSPRLA